MAVVSSLTVRVTGDSKTLSRELRQAQHQFRRYSRFIKRDLRSLSQASKRLATAFTAGAAFALVRSIRTTEQIAKQARNAGLAADEFQRLNHAFRLAGASSGTLAKASLTLSQRIFDLGLGLKTYVDAFAPLNIAYKDIARLSPAESLRLVLERLREMDDETDRAAIAQKLLGRAGKQLGTIMAQTSSEFSAAEERLDRLGGVISKDVLTAAEQLNDEMDVLSTVLQARFTVAIQEVFERIGDTDRVIVSLGNSVERTVYFFSNAANWISQNTTLLKALLVTYISLRISTSRFVGNLKGITAAFIAMRAASSGAAAALVAFRKTLRLLPGIGIAIAINQIINKMTELKDVTNDTIVAFETLTARQQLAQLRHTLSGVIGEINRLLAIVHEEQQAAAQGLLIGANFGPSRAQLQLEEARKEAFRLRSEISEINRELAGFSVDSSSNIGDSIKQSFEDGAETAVRILKDSEFLLPAAERLANTIRGAFQDQIESQNVSFRRLNLREVERRRDQSNLAADLRGRFQQSQPSAASAAALQGFAEDQERQREQLKMIGENFRTDLQGNLRAALADGDYSDLGDALLNSLQNVFLDRISKGLSDLIAPLFDGLFSGLFGGGGFFSFHEGGRVPGSAGQESLALLQAGELVLTEEQQGGLAAMLNGGAATVNNNYTFVGDVDRATRRAVSRLLPDIATGVSRIQREQTAGA